MRACVYLAKVIFEKLRDLHAHHSATALTFEFPRAILQGSVIKQAKQRERWEDITEWNGLWFGKVPEGSREKGEQEKPGCKVICDPRGYAIDDGVTCTHTDIGNVISIVRVEFI